FVRVMALKKAEDSDEIVIRMVELEGRPHADEKVFFDVPVISARMVDGQERTIRDARIVDGALSVDFPPYGLITIAVRLGQATKTVAVPRSTPVQLPYNAIVTTKDNEAASGGFDPDGRCLPAEMLPQQITSGGVSFTLGPVGSGQPDGIA